ncbi:unnamed protein product [Arctia plantaginis]|uniref:PiggyBac transposable element-derived protein domain-containing protein n=1 Tax=Arctia plantaginis TaxID=874455 RepID=A0A8S1A5F3_ARCPL|nr:unnamed protein product [Arctia plantaginis]
MKKKAMKTISNKTFFHAISRRELKYLNPITTRNGIAVMMNRDIKNRRVVSKEPRWRKCDGFYVSLPSIEDNVQKRNDNKRAQKPNASRIFEKIFDGEIFEMIVQNTKLFAAQHNNHDFQVTVDDLKVFFGTLLLTGHHSSTRAIVLVFR